jgi:quercetin 2,3-dioxygenase
LYRDESKIDKPRVISFMKKTHRHRSFQKWFVAVLVILMASAAMAEFSLFKRTPQKMNFTVRKSADRGQADHGWLRSYHTFSFASYRDRKHMGFRSLRVINEDRVDAGQGFGEHPHSDMEIFSVIVSGSLKHQDSLGNKRVLTPGQIQVMSAGSGVTHSEFNPSATEACHFLQIWIEPKEKSVPPRYSEWSPTKAQVQQSKVLIISEDGRDRSAKIHQNADVYRLQWKAGETLDHELLAGRGCWIQLISGELTLNDSTSLSAGDGASTEIAGKITLKGEKPGQALLFDLP